jgi:hypothetical protein
MAAICSRNVRAWGDIDPHNYNCGAFAVTVIFQALYSLNAVFILGIYLVLNPTSERVISFNHFICLSVVEHEVAKVTPEPYRNSDYEDNLSSISL